MKEYTKNGIMFTDDIISSQGTRIILFPEPKHTRVDIQIAKAELKWSRDVVAMYTAGEDDRDDLFKADYFRDPRTRSLAWYQIEQDEKLIRRERRKGTTPEQFVTLFVLPRVKETERKMKKQYGDKIYNI